MNSTNCGTSNISQNTHNTTEIQSQKSLEIDPRYIDVGYIAIMEFVIELPDQIQYWSDISLSMIHPFYTKKEINEKLRVLNNYYNSGLSLLGHFYQLKRNNFKYYQKMIALFGRFIEEFYPMHSLESMPFIDKLCLLKSIIPKIRNKYFKPSYLQRNWIKILLITIIGSWGLIKCFKNRKLIFFAFKELQNTGLQLVKVWIWEPIIRIYETIRYKHSKLKVMGAESLNSDLDSLERMVISFARDSGISNSDELKIIGSKALEGNLNFVLESYEEDLRHPIYSISTGSLVRPLLIQIQKAKVDAGLALSALDTLLRSNELNFAFLAVLPLLGIVGLSITWMRGRWIYWSGKGKASILFSMRKSLRLIEKEFNRNPHSSIYMHPESYGHILVHLTILKRLGAKTFPRIEYKSFLTDLEQLEECFTDAWTVGQGLETCARICRSYPDLVPR